MVLYSNSFIPGFLCSRDTMLKLWDADTGREMRSMGGHTGTITSVILVPNKDMSSSGAFVCLFVCSVFLQPLFLQLPKVQT